MIKELCAQYGVIEAGHVLNAFRLEAGVVYQPNPNLISVTDEYVPGSCRQQ